MRFSALDVLFFAWEVHGRGFRAQVICVLRFNWFTYRLAGTSLGWDNYSKWASGLCLGDPEKLVGSNSIARLFTRQPQLSGCYGGASMWTLQIGPGRL